MSARVSAQFSENATTARAAERVIEERAAAATTGVPHNKILRDARCRFKFVIQG